MTLVQTDDAAGWAALLDAEPENWVARWVYADWLDERGESLAAAAQRWMAANQCHPVIGRSTYVDALRSWDWWRAGVEDYEEDHGAALLPAAIFNCLAGHRDMPNDPEEYHFREHVTRLAAEAALANALRAAGEI